jgi:hypothetical protein
MLRLLPLIVLGVLGSATPALAQRVEVEPLNEPAIARWLIIVLVLLLVALIAVASFKDAKRKDQE